LLASIRPRDEIGRLRRQLAADLLGDLVGLDKKLAGIEADIKALVKLHADRFAEPLRRRSRHHRHRVGPGR
jgi:hypothetical protein